MERTIADRLATAASRSFVGRAEEMDRLGPAVRSAAAPFAVGLVHGPGGIGKTSLLTALTSLADPDVAVLRLDCRDVEPTPRGLLSGLARELAIEADAVGVADVVGALRRRGRATLILDTYEVFGLLDTWLRQTLVPALPVGVVTILAGRERPAPGWLAGPWSGLALEVRLGSLGQADAIQMLRTRGLGELQAARINGFARGHPLALELAASAADAEVTIERGPPPAVIVQLLDVLLADQPGGVRQTLEAVSITRRVTEPVLRTVLDREDVRAEFDALQRLPFVERTGEGLLVHDLVRETVSRDLAERDPEAHARYRRRAWGFFAEAAGRPRAGDGLWQVTADLIYLIKNPVLRAACFPEGAADHIVEPATPADHAAIRAVATRHEPPEAATLLDRWLERHPETFAVARDADGQVAAFVQVTQASTVDPALLADDPVAAAWTAHLARTPPRPGDRVLMMRRWLGRDSGEMLSPPVGVCWLDVKRVYMELRPTLSRLYSVMADHAALSPIFTPLGFAPIGDPLTVGGAAHQPVWLDFGPGSVDGWLSRLVDAEIDAAEADAVPDPAASAQLSPREIEVLRLIAEGLSNRQIGTRLVISEKTAGRHVSNIFTKLGVHNRAQAARRATEWGVT